MLTAQLVKNLPAVREDPGSIPGSGRFPWRRDRLPTPGFLGFPGDSAGQDSTCNVGDLVRSLGWEGPLEKERLPTPVFWPGECHELRSMGSQRVGHDWATFTFLLKRKTVIFGKLTFFQFLGILLKEFLDIVRKKKEAQVYRNEVRHIFTAFDRHCKYL